MGGHGPQLADGGVAQGQRAAAAGSGRPERGPADRPSQSSQRSGACGRSEAGGFRSLAPSSSSRRQATHG